jgi:hypothetical protein
MVANGFSNLHMYMKDGTSRIKNHPNRKLAGTDGMDLLRKNYADHR